MFLIRYLILLGIVNIRDVFISIIHQINDIIISGNQDHILWFVTIKTQEINQAIQEIKKAHLSLTKLSNIFK